MDPHRLFCLNPDCRARRQLGKGNIRLDSRKEGRFRCRACERTFAGRRGTTFYRLRTADETVTQVTPALAAGASVTLLAYDCPVAAIVQSFGLDERTVRTWWQRTGQHCQAVHKHVVAAQTLDLQQVQADEPEWMAHKLLSGAKRAKHQDAEQEAAEAEKRRIAAPEKLAKSGEKAWQTVAAQLTDRHWTYHAKAIEQLQQLRDLADYRHTRTEFNRRLKQLRAQPKGRASIMKRFDQAGLH